MSVHSAAELFSELQQLHILSARQLEDLGPTLHDSSLDVRAAARLLLDRDWLTPFQVNHVLQGQSNRLIVGAYVLIRRIGKSVLGDVYQAKHQRMRRHICLTMIRKELLTRPGAVDRLYQEIQSVSRLSHPHIVCAFDAGPTDDGHFFAAEWVDGIDLSKLVKQNGPLRVPTACAFVYQAALGLEHAAGRGVLHHDLKPANLLISRLTAPTEAAGDDSVGPSTSSAFDGPCLKINNLGLSLLQPRAAGAAPVIAGSPDYLAPELADGGTVSDVRSNLYSLGCVFFWALTGKAPFPGDDSSTVLKKHRDAPPPALAEFRGDVPPDVEAIVRRLLAKRPEDRYSCGAELAAELARQTGGEAPSPPTPPVLTDTQAANVDLDGWPTSAVTSDHTKKIPDRPEPVITRPAAAVWGRRLRVLACVGLFLGLACLGAYALSVMVPAAAPQTNDEPPPPSAQLPAPESAELKYVKGASRQETILATLKASRLPNLAGPWYYIGPFEAGVGDGFHRTYPPEKEVDLKRSYYGKSNILAAWKEFHEFRPGKVQNLRMFGQDDNAAVYLYIPIETAAAVDLPVGFGSDDTLTVWLNHKQLIAKNVSRGLSVDSEVATLKLHPGKNELLIKICNGNGDWAAYVMPRWPEALEKAFGDQLDRDFPK